MKPQKWVWYSLLWMMIGGGLQASPGQTVVMGSRSIGYERSPVDATIPELRPPRLRLALRLGTWRPADEGIKLVYGARVLRYSVSGGWLVSPELLISLGIGFSREEGSPVGSSSREPSGETSTLTLYPIELDATYRVRWISTSTLEPYVTLGLDSSPYSEELSDSTVSGGKWGAHARGGLAIKVDGGPIAPWSADANQGIQKTSILVEAGYSAVGNFGFSGFALSGLLIQAGISLDF